MTQDELKELSKEMREQDNLATGHPLYCVFEKDYIYGMDGQWGDIPEVILDCEGNEVDGQDYEMTEDEWKNLDEDQLSDYGLIKTYYIKKDKFVNAHFTMRAAKLFIEQNKHNLTEPFVYVTSLYRCHEMIKIQDYLKSISA